MKRITSRTAILASTLAAAFMMIAPASALPAAARTTATNASGKTSPFCTKLASDSNSITGKLGVSQGKVTQAWAQQDQKLTANEQQVDQTVAADRGRADTARQADFAKLEAKATTGTEQDAVKAYETAVNNAVNTRRAAYDAARQAFRTGVKDAISTRRAASTAQMDAFQSSVNAAISTAGTSCASNPGGSSAIRQTFVGSLKSARQTFQNQRKGDAAVGAQVKQLAQTRNAAFKAADQAFQASLKTARQTLSQTLGKAV